MASIYAFSALPCFSSSSTKPLLPTRTPALNLRSNVEYRVCSSWILKKNRRNLICRAEKEYKFPDPIPEFAEAETNKFRAHLTEKLLKKEELFGDSVDEVVEICTKILNEFLHSEYGGPGTLLVMPFIDMADTLNERGLPGGPQAARAAVKWAQKNVDNDWKQWNATSAS